MSMQATNLGQILRLARERAGWKSQTAYANFAGIPQRTYAVDESGKRNFIPEERAIIYSKTLGIPLEKLLGKGHAAAVFAWPFEHLHAHDLQAFHAIAKGANPFGQNHSPVSVSARTFTFCNPDKAMSIPGREQILPGDLLLFDAEMEFESGAFVLAYVHGDPAPIFRAIKFEGENSNYKYTLFALNPTFPAIQTTSAKCDIIASLAFVMRPSARLI